MRGYEEYVSDYLNTRAKVHGIEPGKDEHMEYNELFQVWIGDLMGQYGVQKIEDLNPDAIRLEIAEMKDYIKNDEIWCDYDSMEQHKAYVEYLEELLDEVL